MDEILDEIKLQMDDDISVSTVYKTLDKYSRRELIDNASFMRALKHDLKFHLDQIDLDFTSRLYRDKRNKEFIRYSTFMDDLRQKFELTETYIVPGAKRKAPTNTADVLMSTKFTKQDYENQRKEEALKDILSDLKKELHDKEIDIEREFKKYNPDGFVTESEFREVFSNYRLQFSPNEVDILIDRYVNTFDESIDTNVMCDHLHDLDDFVKTKSIFDSSKEPARKSITYKVAKKLEKLKITRKAIRYIERTDVHQENYLSFDQLKKAFWKANFKLSSAQLEELLLGVSQNDQGNYNYPEMFRIMFGDRYKQRIVVMDRSVPSLKETGQTKRDETHRKDTKRDDRGRSLNQRSRSGKRYDDDRSERSHRSHKSRDERKRSRSRLGSSLKRSSRRDKSSARRSSRRSGSRSRSHRRHGSRSKSKGRSVRFSKSRTRDGSRRRHATSKSAGRSRSGKRRDTGKMARYIGRKLKQSKYDYINHLKKYAGEDIDFILSERQIFKMTFAAGIKLSKEDKKEFVKDMGRENFSVEEFLSQ